MPVELPLKGLEHQLELMVQAVWGTHFSVFPIPDQVEFIQPYISENQIFLPASYEAETSEQAKQFYLSSALHCAAHLIYSVPWSSEGLNNRQKVLVSIFEDARIETLSQRHFSGLKKLFSKQFVKPKDDGVSFEGLAYQLAYALNNEGFDPINSLIVKACNGFFSLTESELNDPDSAYILGLALANDIGQMRISMNEKTAFHLLGYRDNNAYLWESFSQIASESEQQDAITENVGITGVAFEETEDGKFVASYQASASEASGLTFVSTENDTEHQLLNKGATDQALMYPEWDYRIGRLKQNWCTLLEQSKPDTVFNAMDTGRHNGLINRLQKIIQTYQFNRQKKRKQEQGIELDLEALVQYRTYCLMGRPPTEANIYIDHLHSSEQEIALLVLLDLSESMNDAVEDTDVSLLEITSESLYVLSSLLDRLGHHYAIHGFHSNGRHEVSYQHFKDFEEKNYGDLTGLPELSAAYSTRLGTTLRHAYQQILARPEPHKLVMVISDGQPADIDVFDERYLIEDAGYVVREAEYAGCKTFCLSLDQTAENYAAQIFQKGHFEVIDHPQKLPEILTRLYLKLFKAYLK